MVRGRKEMWFEIVVCKKIWEPAEVRRSIAGGFVGSTELHHGQPLGKQLAEISTEKKIAKMIKRRQYKKDGLPPTDLSHCPQRS